MLDSCGSGARRQRRQPVNRFGEKGDWIRLQNLSLWTAASHLSRRPTMSAVFCYWNRRNTYQKTWYWHGTDKRLIIINWEMSGKSENLGKYVENTENILKNMQTCKRGCGNYMKTHGNIRKYMEINYVHGFAFICYVLTCILNVCTCFVICFCVFLVFGPIQKDARRKNINFGGTQTSRSFTRTRLVTKTMDGLNNPPNVHPINYN